jgi:hypothetical protein
MLIVTEKFYTTPTPIFNTTFFETVDRITINGGNIKDPLIFIEGDENKQYTFEQYKITNYIADFEIFLNGIKVLDSVSGDIKWHIDNIENFLSALHLLSWQDVGGDGNISIIDLEE